MFTTAPYVRGFLTRQGVADRLGVSLRVVDKWLANGLLPYLKLGRAVRIDPADVDEFLANHRRPLTTTETLAS
jgi:excisionase family DNA binding protein